MPRLLVLAREQRQCNLVTDMQFVYLILVFNLVTIFAYAKDDISMGSITFAANELLVEQEVAQILIKDIYAKINLKTVISPLPPSRANTMNVSQQIDGEIARIYLYGEKNPSLVRIEPAYYYLTSTAYCLEPKKINIKSKAELKKYSVAVIQGVAHSDEATKDHDKKTVVNNGIQMYEMVLNGRAQIALDTKINGRKIIKNKKFSNIYDCGSFAKYDLHNYLNSKSAHHKEAISSMIKKLKKSGELEKMIQKAEDEVLNRSL